MSFIFFWSNVEALEILCTATWRREQKFAFLLYLELLLTRKRKIRGFLEFDFWSNSQTKILSFESAILSMGEIFA